MEERDITVAFFRNFGIITPYSNRFLTHEDISKLKHDYISTGLPALSFYDILDRESEVEYVPSKISYDDTTLANIVRENCEYVEKHVQYAQKAMSGNLSREDMEKEIKAYVINELNRGKITPKTHPIRSLMFGHLIAGNWKYLSDDDFNMFVISYGVSREKEKVLQLASIISIQNGIFRELLYRVGDTFEMRGVNVIKEFIQPMYDAEKIMPDWGAPVMSESFRKQLWDSISIKETLIMPKIGPTGLPPLSFESDSSELPPLSFESDSAEPSPRRGSSSPIGIISSIPLSGPISSFELHRHHFPDN